MEVKLKCRVLYFMPSIYVAFRENQINSCLRLVYNAPRHALSYRRQKVQGFSAFLPFKKEKSWWWEPPERIRLRWHINVFLRSTWPHIELRRFDDLNFYQFSFQEFFDAQYQKDRRGSQPKRRIEGNLFLRILCLQRWKDFQSNAGVL